MLPASAVPLIAGVGLLIDPEVVIVGAAIVVSIVLITSPEAVDTLLDASVAVTVKE